MTTVNIQYAEVRAEGWTKNAHTHTHMANIQYSSTNNLLIILKLITMGMHGEQTTAVQLLF